MNNTSKRFTGIVFLLATFFCGLHGQQGKGDFSISFPGIPDTSLKKIEITLLRTGYRTISASRMLETGLEVALSIPLIRAGRWFLQAEARDGRNIARYRGTTVIDIVAGQSVTASVQMRPLDGSLKVIATWGSIDPEVFLSDLKEERVFNLNGTLGKDTTYWGGPLTVKGVKHKKALVTHPEAGEGFVEYRLQKKYSKFIAMIAILDDSYASGDSHGNGRFFVETDGNRVFESPVLRWNGVQSMDVEVDVKGVEILRLCVDNGNGINWSDHAAWINARLEPRRH